MLPVSVAMFLASVAGSRLALKYSTRSIVRSGLSVILVAALLLLWTIQPSLRGLGFATAMALLGLGMGLIASQVGNVVQSSVDASGRSEAGGLQYTSQQLGSAVGVALIGAIVLSGLTATFLDKVESDPRITDQVEQEATIAVQGGVSFVSTDTVEQGATDAGLPPDQVAALTENYADSQLVALKVGLLASAAIALGALAATGGLPSKRPTPGGPRRPRRADDGTDDATSAPTPRSPSELAAAEAGHAPFRYVRCLARSTPARPGGRIHRFGRHVCLACAGRRLNGWRGSFRVAELPSAGCRRSTRRCPPSPSRS